MGTWVCNYMVLGGTRLGTILIVMTWNKRKSVHGIEYVLVMLGGWFLAARAQAARHDLPARLSLPFDIGSSCQT